MSSQSCILALSMLLSGILIHAQNLAINPSFEEFINFNTSGTNGWHKAQDTDTPGYFYFENGDGKDNIFNTYAGGAVAKTGKGFIGIFC